MMYQICYLFTYAMIKFEQTNQGIIMGKSFGSTLECSDERIDALMNEYVRQLDSKSRVKAGDVFNRIVECPCSRFWVSGFRAAVVVAGIMKGDDLSTMRPLKREMFYEIYNRVIKLKEKYPDHSLFKLASMAVLQPAPKFYLSPSSAKIMYYKAKREWYRKRIEALKG